MIRHLIKMFIFILQILAFGLLLCLLLLMHIKLQICKLAAT